MEEKVVLVNEKDEILGLMEKMQAHENGILPVSYTHLDVYKRQQFTMATPSFIFANASLFNNAPSF